MPPLLHVLGAGPWQLPTLRRAKARGLRVLVTDLFAERPGYAVADMHEQVDITDPAATLAAARRHGIDGILCDTTDIGVATAAHVAAALGLPGIGADAAARCTRKDLLRQACAARQVDQPCFRVVGDRSAAQLAGAALGLPLIAKPVDNQSGRGVMRVDTPDRVASAFAHALAHSRAGAVVMEQWVDGSEHIVDGVVFDGRAVMLAIASKPADARNVTIGTRIDYLSGADFERAHEQLAPTVQAVVRAVGLTQGVFHAELLASPQRVVPIDFAARGGGVMIHHHVVEHVCGTSPIDLAIDAALGHAARPALQARRGASIRFLQAPRGLLRAVSGVAEAAALPGVAAVHIAVEPGSPVGALQDKEDRPGFVVALADDTAEARAIADRACGLLHFDILAEQP